MTINKNIFFYWTGSEIPNAFRRNIEYTKLICPDHEVRVVGDDVCRPLVEQYFPDELRLYDAIAIPAAKSDIARILLLYHFGGWYLDCDTQLRTNIDHWEEEDIDLYLFLRRNENNRLLIPNRFIGGRREHPFFLRAIKLFFSLLKSKFNHYSVYKTTGPDALLAAYGVYLEAPMTRLSEIKSELLQTCRGKSTGSWKYQQNCGIWYNDDNPPNFKPNPRFIKQYEKLDAFRFYCSVFDWYPDTRQNNYVSLLNSMGCRYLKRHNLVEEIDALTEEFKDSFTNGDYFHRLAQTYRELGERKYYRKYLAYSAHFQSSPTIYLMRAKASVFKRATRRLRIRGSRP